ncbi:MAG: hydrogenase expression/formation protein HypE [Alphaproteobacteria bacterium]|nr:hydrogenase expression/formation protein HypE [Alphaproteobacteria bacterium]MCB9696924.1 hydrogenase expression/formation protein HypE [Alphaproteobacteria bacterium]
MSDHPLFQRIERFRRRAGRVREDVVTQAHGGGGRAMRDLIDDLVIRNLGPDLQADEDQARIGLAELMASGDRLAFTTDSYVVSPLEFPGGDIGRLAVNGTVNDLAVGGAIPRFLSVGLVIEEGLPVATLRRILKSMGEAAREAGVSIVTGDTKVVQRGAADQLFVNTAGIGVIPRGVEVSSKRVRADDVILVNGMLGDHGAAILVARGELKLACDIPSDCAPLHTLTQALLAGVDVHAMRDVTRGGLAAVLNELALGSEVGMQVDEVALPVRPEVRGFCEVLGLDPVHLANEGKLVAAVPADQAARALEILRAHPLGTHAAVIARCRAEPPGVVTLGTGFGGERILDVLVGEQLPRIC